MADEVERESEKAMMTQENKPKEVDSIPATSTGGELLPPNSLPDHHSSRTVEILSGESHRSKFLSRLKAAATSLSSKPIGSLSRGRSSEKQKISNSPITGSIDQEFLDCLNAALRSSDQADDERAEMLMELEAKVSQGFNLEIQEILLKSGTFAAVEAAAIDHNTPDLVKELAAKALLAIVRFNKAVFVGKILTSPAVSVLVSIASAASLSVLCGLIASIKSALVDELLSNGKIPRIVALLRDPDLEIRCAALECCLEIGYYGRKEAIDATLEAGLIDRLLELQGSELGGALIEMDGRDAPEGRRKRYLESHPFASCVARFSVQADVGEGLRQREKRAFKLEIVQRLREAALADAQAATVLAEVLWGSTP